MNCAEPDSEAACGSDERVLLPPNRRSPAPENDPSCNTQIPIKPSVPQATIGLHIEHEVGALGRRRSGLQFEAGAIGMRRNRVEAIPELVLVSDSEGEQAGHVAGRPVQKSVFKKN